MSRTLPALILLCATATTQAAERPRLFQPPLRPAVPVAKGTALLRNPIDSFVLAALEAKNLTLSAEAERLTLLRRVTFDLHGLPPTIAEQEAFLRDRSPRAYERVVERLLSSPRYGERQALHWLDLVRYAETDGFKEDAHRPEAHRYRDFVIRAFNANLPYDRFIRQQLAGDELEPNNPEALIATGFNRLWPDEWNAANLEQRRQEILDDTTDTAALVFLGLTFGCARCHDHKYDPISQRDYFRLQSFFVAMQPREVSALTAEQRQQHQEQLAQWEKKTAKVRGELDAILNPKRKELSESTLGRFNPDIQAAVRTAPEKRTPLQWQIALMAQKQLDRAAKTAATKLPAEKKKRVEELQKQLATFGPAPSEPIALAVTDIGPTPPPTHRLVGGDWRKLGQEVKPAFPESLGGGVVDVQLAADAKTTGRRTALAQWLTRDDHPLTARVMVNRLWQQHFGQGIVATPSDFGEQGNKPTHPELLDWLARELVDSGWDLKHLHRLMVTSATYRQASAVDPDNAVHGRGMEMDRENNLLWHARRRRLEGEAIRDAALFLAGELNDRMYGVSARPELPEAVGKIAWKADEKPADRNRRSIYVYAKRNLRYPLFEAFDQPDLHNSCARRLTTTTAPQALQMLNGDLTIGLALRWAEQLGTGNQRAIESAYRAAWGRNADAEDVRLALRFLERQAGVYRAESAPEESARRSALVDFCHAVLNTNEFIFVD